MWYSSYELHCLAYSLNFWCACILNGKYLLVPTQKMLVGDECVIHSIQYPQCLHPISQIPTIPKQWSSLVDDDEDYNIFNELGKKE